jgi:hypothetical protein
MTEKLPSDLSFLSADIKRQQEIAQRALDEAKRLDELVAQATSEELRHKLKQSRDSMLSLARDLAINATSTSTAATITIVGGGAPSK